MMQKCIHILAILVFAISCNSENVRHSFEAENGLTSDSVSSPTISEYNSIFEPNAPKRITRNVKLDQEGNLIIAAYDDVIRYDGTAFTKLQLPEGLESWYAFDALEDRQKNVWIASDQSGAYRIDSRTGSVTNFTTKDGLGHLRNMCIYEDKAGNIWIGGQGGLSKYDGNKFINYTAEDGLPHNDINTIIEDKKGNIWFGTRGHAGLYDGKTFTEIKSGEGRPFYNVWSILEDNTDNIWLTDSSGLWKNSGNTFNYQLPDVWKIYQDGKGIYWCTGMLDGGGSALNRLEISKGNGEEIKSHEVFKSDNMFFGVVEDKEGNIWVGGGDGVWFYNGETITYYTGVNRNDE